MKVRPSGIMAIPSSWFGPEVTCSGAPSGKRCLQMGEDCPSSTPRNIHLPSVDHAADVQPAFGGPTCLEFEPPNFIKRHCSQPPLSLSDVTTHSSHSDLHALCPLHRSQAHT